MNTSMKNFYIIKQNNGILFNFYYSNFKIKYKISDTTNWSEEKIVIEDCQNNFCVLLAPNDTLYLLCQDNLGNIILCTYNNILWNKKIILNKKSNSADLINFSAILHNKDIHLFYNIIDRTNRRQALIHQIAINGTDWLNSKVIDILDYTTTTPFIILQNAKKEIYIFYEIIKDEFKLGYKKFSYSKKAWSDFQIIDNSAFSSVDTSFIISNNYVHSLYVKNEKYYYNVMYRCKNYPNDNPKMLFQGPKVSSCVIFALDNNIWALWICDNNIYSCFSADEGKTFTPPTIHTNLNDFIPKKILYKSNVEDEKKHLLLNEIYVNNINDLNFMVIPDLFPSIINLSTALDNNFEKLPLSTIGPHLEYIKAHIDEVYEKMYLAKKQLNEKEHLVCQLNYTLQNKNLLISNLEDKLRTIENNSKLFTIENTSLKEKTFSLEKELICKQKELKQFNETLLNKQREIEDLKKELSNISQIQVEQVSKEETSKKDSFLKRLFSDINN